MAYVKYVMKLFAEFPAGYTGTDKSIAMKNQYGCCLILGVIKMTCLKCFVGVMTNQIIKDQRPRLTGGVFYCPAHMIPEIKDRKTWGISGGIRGILVGICMAINAQAL